MMEQEKQFNYTYSAKDTKEIQEIRNKYLPQNESKTDELRRLDEQVSKSGMAESLAVGIVGSLIFGTGMCLAMEVLGSGWVMIILGVAVGIMGMVLIGCAYPVYRKKQKEAKEKFAPRILELADALTSEV